MSKKLIITISLIVLILITALAIRFVFGGPEDAWLCADNKWIKHGNPEMPMPSVGCGSEKTITNFIECEAAGNPVMESYPRQCNANGKNFTEELPDEVTELEYIPKDVSDLIILDYPQPEAEVSAPLKIRGNARGNWFFEASFPVTLTNWDGLIIAEGVATAEGDWMTEDFVPFSLDLNYTVDTTVSNRGSLILKKDNPSGLPENDAFLEITVFFK